MGSSVPEGFGVPEEDLIEVVVPNDLRAAKQPEDDILAALARSGYCPDMIFAIKLALEEAMTNAVKHGNRNDPSKTIVVRYFVDTFRAVIMVRDEGGGFAPSKVPDPTVGDNIERPYGRGIMLMQSYMTRVWFNPGGNEVWLLKERQDTAP